MSTSRLSFNLASVTFLFACGGTLAANAIILGQSKQEIKQTSELVREHTLELKRLSQVTSDLQIARAESIINQRYTQETLSRIEKLVSDNRVVRP